ncbi:MAG TPA: hypothetical protein VH333_03210 [Pseudonocardiaceae bacterium]|nr:hypothetical protein [Pseudonocardiaceae bacterium]
MSGADVLAETGTAAVTPAPERRPAGERAGRVLSVASLLPALLATAWVVAAFPLAALGWFHPATAIPLFVVVAAVLVPLGLSLVRQAAVAVRTPWWSVAATGVVALGFTVFAAMSHSAHTIPRRDAGSYAQIGFWLAHHGSPLYPVPLAAFGPSAGPLSFASPAFYQPGGSVIPQFMTGWPTMLAGADWVGGWTGLLLLPTVVGGCAIVAVGGLAARLVGARWAPLAALLTAGAWPMLRSSQETLSEPLALLTLVAGACLLVDWMQARKADGLRARINRHTFAAGLVLAAGELVRLDVAVDFALVVPVLGWLWHTRRPGVLPFLGGALIGAGLAVWDSLAITSPYVTANWTAVRLELLLLGGTTAATVLAMVLLGGRSPVTLRWWRYVPEVGVAIVAVTGIGLVVRPWVLIDHSTTDVGVAAYVSNIQRSLNLPVDGSRGYAELSLRWVAWYLGWPLLAIAFLAAGYLTWRVLRGRDLRWLPILLIFLCSTVLVLLRPGITPDHPWADRRLVVEVVPCFVLLATGGTAALAKLVATRWRRPGLARVLAVVLVVAFLVPEGIALTPVAALRTEQGEVIASYAVCSVLRPNDSVVLIDPMWMPVIRSQCGLPVAQLRDASPVSVRQVVASIKKAGRTPVIAGSQVNSPAPLGLIATNVIDLHTQEDQQQLLHRASGTQPLFLQFWAARP